MNYLVSSLMVSAVAAGGAFLSTDVMSTGGNEEYGNSHSNLNAGLQAGVNADAALRAGAEGAVDGASSSNGEHHESGSVQAAGDFAARYTADTHASLDANMGASSEADVRSGSNQSDDDDSSSNGASGNGDDSSNAHEGEVDASTDTRADVQVDVQADIRAEAEAGSSSETDEQDAGLSVGGLQVSL